MPRIPQNTGEAWNSSEVFNFGIFDADVCTIPDFQRFLRDRIRSFGSLSGALRGVSPLFGGVSGIDRPDSLNLGPVSVIDDSDQPNEGDPQREPVKGIVLLITAIMFIGAGVFQWWDARDTRNALRGAIGLGLVLIGWFIFDHALDLIYRPLSGLHAQFRSSGPFLAFGFGLAPCCELALLRREVRAGFQLVVFASEAVEENDLLGIFSLRHGVLTLGIAVTALAFWKRDAKAPASSDALASSYSAPENVRVLAVVEPEGKLVQIQRQVLRTHVVIRPDDATLEQTPERIDALGMNFAAYILACGMSYRVVLVAQCSKIFIAGVVIGRDQIHFPADGFSDKAIKRGRISVFDHLTYDIAFARDRADNGRFVAAESALAAFLIPVAILILATKVGLVHLDNTHELTKIGIFHSRTEPMAHIERCAVGAGTDHAMNLKGTHPFLAREHQIQNLEPDQQLVIRVLEDRPADDRESIAVLLTNAALPVPSFEVKFVDFRIVAARAFNYSIGPASIHQVSLTGVFIRKEGVKFRKRHLANELRFTFLPYRVHEEKLT
jgi:hypothetical protein